MRENIFNNDFKKLIFILIILINIIIIQTVNGQNCDSLWNIYNNAKNDTTRIKLLNEEIGYIYETINIDSAIFFYNKAIALADKNIMQKTKNETTFLNLKATSLRYIGIVYIDNEQFDKAIEYYLKSLKIFTQIGNSEGMASCYTNLGNAYNNKSDYYKAIEFFLKSLKIDEKSGNKKGVSMCYTNIGAVYASLGNYDKSIEYFLMSLKIKEELKDIKGISNCYNNIGIIHKEQGNYKKSIEFLLKALEIDEKNGDQIGASYCITNIANVYKNQGDDDNALSYYFKALDFFEKYDDKIGMTSCYGNIGSMYLRKAEYDKASEFFLKSLKINEDLGFKEGIAQIYFQLSSLNVTLSEQKNISAQIKLNYVSKSIDYGLKSMFVAQEIKALPRIYDAAEVLMESYKISHNYIKYMEYAEIFIATKDSMFSEEKTKALTEMGTKYESEKKQLEIDKMQKQKELDNKTIEAQQAENKKQQIIIVSAIGGFLIILVFSIIILRMFGQKRKANILLASQNAEITQQKEEISAQRDEIEAQRDTVVLQRDHIEEQNKEITDSINYAKRIQHAVLPDFDTMNMILGEHFILFKPKDIVSGDFYWATIFKNWQIYTVADCTGHGVPGAFMSMLGISFINEIVRKEEVSQASHILDHLRTRIIESLKQKGISGEQKDGMDISMCVLNLETQKLQFAGANNPLWIVKSEKLKVNSDELQDESLSSPSSYKVDKKSNSFAVIPNSPPVIPNEREESNFQLYELKPDKMPIAIYERMDEFTNHEIEINQGDCLYLMSDGYEDQFGGLKGKKFLSKNLKQLLLDNSQLTMKKQKEILEKTITDWIGDGEQIDDITVMGIKI